MFPSDTFATFNRVRRRAPPKSVYVISPKYGIGTIRSSSAAFGAPVADHNIRANCVRIHLAEYRVSGACFTRYPRPTPTRLMAGPSPLRDPCIL